MAVVADVAEVAVEALPLKVAVIVPAVKFPDASRATIVEAVFALVALEVTVNVAAEAWLAVKVCEPDSPVPDTFIVNVALLTVGISEVNAIVPVVAGIVIVVVPAAAAALKLVVPDVEPLKLAPPPPIVGVVNEGEVPNTLAPLPVDVVTPVPPLATGSVPVTPVVKGKPVHEVKVPEEGVPRTGVTNVGEVLNTLLPEPVEVVTPVPPAKTGKVPAANALADVE